MAIFKSVPTLVVPFSAKDEEASKQWAMDYIDILQDQEAEDVYLSADFKNLKLNQYGQVLSTKYAEAVKKVFNQDSAERIFVINLATKEDLENIDMSSEIDDRLSSLKAEMAIEQASLKEELVSQTLLIKEELMSEIKSFNTEVETNDHSSSDEQVESVGNNFNLNNIRIKWYKGKS